jgi:hypothetical protein
MTARRLKWLVIYGVVGGLAVACLVAAAKAAPIPPTGSVGRNGQSICLTLDRRGHCVTVRQLQARWLRAHPRGRAPRRVRSKTAAGMATTATAATSCVGRYVPTCNTATRFYDWAHTNDLRTVTIDRRLPALPSAARWCLHVPDGNGEVKHYLPGNCDAENYLGPRCVGYFEAAFNCTMQGTQSEFNDYTEYLLTTRAGCRLPQPTPSECAVFQAPLPFVDGFEAGTWRIHT